MADTTTPRPSTGPRRRRPHVKYVRRVNGFARAIRAFNASLEEHFPLVPYRDCVGRNRLAGRARRARAAAVLKELLELQPRVRSGIVYEGYGGLGARMHRSRSTAYRGVKDLRDAKLLKVVPGGGKTYNEAGKLVEAANGYQVPDDLAGPEQRQPPKPRKGPPGEVNERTPGQVMAAEYRERGRPTRAGP